MSSDIVRGYEYDKGQFVIISDSEIEAINTEKDRIMQIIHFTRLNSIDPVYYNTTYYAIPAPGAEKPFELFRLVLMKAQLAAVVRTVLNTKESQFTLIPREHGLMAHTMYYHNEVREMPAYTAPAVEEAEVEMAAGFIKQLVKDYDPTQYKESFQELLKELIKAKIENREIVMAPESASEPTNVVDFMEALKMAVEEQSPKKGRKKRVVAMDVFGTKNISPMLIADNMPAFDSPDYLYELKFDGVRCIAYLDRRGVVLRNKQNKNIGPIYPDMMGAYKQLRSGKKKCILDGELFVMHKGRPVFDEIQRRALMTNPFKIQLAAGKLPVTFTAFDLLYLNGVDLTKIPLTGRIAELRACIDESERMAVSMTIEHNGITFFNAAAERGLEGIVAKRKDSLY